MTDLRASLAVHFSPKKKRLNQISLSSEKSPPLLRKYSPRWCQVSQHHRVMGSVSQRRLLGFLQESDNRAFFTFNFRNSPLTFPSLSPRQLGNVGTLGPWWAPEASLWFAERSHEVTDQHAVSFSEQEETFLFKLLMFLSEPQSRVENILIKSVNVNSLFSSYLNAGKSCT